MPQVTQWACVEAESWACAHELPPAEAASRVGRGRTQLQEPALPVRVEEGVGQIIPIVLRNLERLVSDAVVEVLWAKTGSAILGTQGSAGATQGSETMGDAPPWEEEGQAAGESKAEGRDRSPGREEKSRGDSQRASEFPEEQTDGEGHGRDPGGAREELRAELRAWRQARRGQGGRKAPGQGAIYGRRRAGGRERWA